MKTIFSLGNNSKSRKTHSHKMRFQPQLEPLEDRQLLAAAGLLSTVAGELGPTDKYAEMELQVGSQNGKAPVLGIRVDAVTAGFDPSAISAFDSNGTKVPDSAIQYSNADYGGTSSSLLLVQLAPGDYYIRVGGDKSTYGSFTCDVFLPGDINRDGTISSHEKNMLNAAFQYSSGKWNAVTAAAYEKQGIYVSDVKAYISEFAITNAGIISLTDMMAISTNSEVGKVTVDLEAQMEMPVVTAELVKVDATTIADKITSNPAVKGTVTNSKNVTLKASFNGKDWTDVTLNSDGTFTVDAELMKTMVGSPVASNGAVSNGKYEISFKATNKRGDEATTSVKYVVIADNVAPTANNKTYQAKAYDAVPGSLKELVSHKDEAIGNVLSFVAGTYQSTKGVTVTIDDKGNFQYVQGDKFASLREGEPATDTFTYKVRDSLGRESTGTITIAITGVNAKPFLKTAIPDQTTNQNTDKTIDVLPYFDDPNVGDVLSIKSVTPLPANSGTVSIVDGKLVFKPGNDFKSLPLGQSSTIEITFFITDNATTPLTVDGKVKLTVTGLNDAPIAQPYPAPGTELPKIEKNKTLDITVADTKSTDPDEGETATLIYGWIGRGDQGKAVTAGAETRIDFTEGDYVIVSADGMKLTYNPGTRFTNLGAGKSENAEFEYQVKDVHGALSNKATIKLTVLGANDPPVIHDTTPVTASGGKKDVIYIPFSAFIAKASDPNGDAIVVSRVVPDVSSGKGTFTVDTANQRVIFNPGNDFLALTAGKSEVITFKFWVKDEHGAESLSSGTGKVTITGSNDPLSINDQTFSVTSGGTGNATCTVQTVGYSDSCRFEIVGTPTGGPDGHPMPAFTINATTGVISVARNSLPATTAADKGYKLTVKITNPNDSADTATATITINVVTKAPPVPPSTPLKLTTSETATANVTGTITGVTNGGDPIEFATTLVAKSFIYEGTTYTITNNKFTINGKEYDITGGIGSITAAGVVSFNPNGKFNFLPEGKSGTLVLEYTVKDKESGSAATGRIEVTLSGVNSQPVSKGTIPNQATNQNTSQTFDVRPYFDDPDIGDVLRVKAGSVTVTGGGTVSINGSGNIVFNPGNDFKHLPKDVTAEVTVSFVIEDSATTPKTVSGSYKIIVTGLNDAPVAKDYTAPAIDRNKTAVITIASTGSTDPDDNETASLAYGWVGRGTQGKDVTPGTATTINFTEGDSVTVSADGKTLTYNPGTRYENNGKGTNATATFEYKVKDIHGELSANKGTISVEVRGISDPPTIKKQIDDYVKVMGETVTVNLTEYFGGQNLTFSLGTKVDPSHMLDVSISGNTLTIKFLDNYNSANNRIPVEITVTATNTDNASVSQKFKAAAIPQTTVEVVAVPYKDGEQSASHIAKYADITAPTNFEVKVGDTYYIEIWVSDILNEAIKKDYSKALAQMIVSLQYDSSVAKILGMELAPGSLGVLDPSIDIFDFSTPGELIGGSFWSVDGAAVNGNSWRMLRIRVEAIGEGDAKFKFNKTENWDSEKFAFGRLTNVDDGLEITNDQVSTKIPSIKHISATAPLLAEETPERVVTGGVYPRVVTAPTNTTAAGTVADIPENADWIHEWQEHWVELWVKASDAVYFLNGTCDLNFNTNYFTAVEVELSPAFRGNSSPVINDSLGKVAGIGGNSTQLVSGDGYVLLGRVKFQSLGTDNVAFSEAWYAHDLGISLENVKVTTSANETLFFAGKSPRTELWAVPYDTTDSGKVEAVDLLKFLNGYSQSRELDSYMVSLFDYNKDGKVDAKDLLNFLSAYRVTRDSGMPVFFPKTFTQRYVGKTLDADSAATVNKIIDAANKAWQMALGLDRPVEIQIVVQDFGAGNDQLATAQITAVDANGLPLKGIITLDTTAAGMGWYSQITEPVANGRYDLFTVLLHEMGHIYGFNTSYDAFNEVVGQYVSQLDTSKLHAGDSADLMYATLAPGVRKYISTFDTAIITSAYDAAKANPKLGFSNSVASLSTAVPTVETLPVNISQPDLTAFAVLENGGFVTTLNHPVLALAVPQKQMVDTDTALRLHAMGLAVTMPLNMQQREENRFSFTVEQIYNDETSFFDLSDDDLVTLHQPQDADGSELALMFGLAMDLDA